MTNCILIAKVANVAAEDPLKRYLHMHTYIREIKQPQINCIFFYLLGTLTLLLRVFNISQIAGDPRISEHGCTNKGFSKEKLQ